VRIRHLILDRDGVLNQEAPRGGYILQPQEFQWLPDALEALALLRRAGVRLSVATNQSAVGRGLMTAADLDAIHARMRREATAAGATLAAVFACPHAPDAGCGCRKPAPGLILQAITASGIDPAHTLLAGDDLRDLQAAQAAGIRAALVRTGKGAQTERGAATSAMDVAVYDDLLQLAHALVGAP